MSANSEKEEEALQINEISKDKIIAVDVDNSLAVAKAEQNHTCSKSIMSKDSSLQKHFKRNEVAVLDFSGIDGPFALPSEFRAPEVDFHEAQHKVNKIRLTRCIKMMEHETLESGK